jgi:hypothetical protein
LLKLTAEGHELVASWGVEVKGLPKNASLEHEYWKKLTAERYRAEGYSVEEEVPIGGGKAVDLVATKDGKRVAIEVETGKSDAVRIDLALRRLNVHTLGFLFKRLFEFDFVLSLCLLGHALVLPGVPARIPPAREMP